MKDSVLVKNTSYMSGFTKAVVWFSQLGFPSISLVAGYLGGAILNAPINVTPHYPYSGARWGFEISIASTYGTYPIIKSLCRRWGITGDLTHAV